MKNNLLVHNSKKIFKAISKAISKAKVLRESTDPRTEYLRMNNTKFVKWLRLNCEEGSPMWNAADRIENLLLEKAQLEEKAYR